MNIVNEYPVMVFRNDREGKVFYSLGLSKKNQDNSYSNGYIGCRFKKDVELENQTKIYIKKAWLDFYLKGKITVPYIFISEFETLKNAMQQSKKDTKVEEYEDINVVHLSDEDLPF